MTHCACQCFDPEQFEAGDPSPRVPVSAFKNCCSVMRLGHKVPLPTFPLAASRNAATCSRKMGKDRTKQRFCNPICHSEPERFFPKTVPLLRRISYPEPPASTAFGKCRTCSPKLHSLISLGSGIILAKALTYEGSS